MEKPQGQENITARVISSSEPQGLRGQPRRLGSNGANGRFREERRFTHVLRNGLNGRFLILPRDSGMSPTSATADIQTKLRMDFLPATSPFACMSDPDSHCLRLIEDLLLEAGRMMENSSVDFALSLPDIAAVAARIDGLDLIASDLQALCDAARALLRRAASD